MVRSIFTGSPNVAGLQFDPLTGDLYVLHDGCYGNLSIVHVATGKILKNIGLACYPRGVTFDPSTDEIWIAEFGDVAVVGGSSRSILFHTANNSVGYGIAYAATSQEVFIANPASNNVTVVSARTGRVLVWGISAGNFPYDVVYDNVTNEVYVANFDPYAGSSGNLSSIDASTNKVNAWIPVRDRGNSPWGLAYSAASRTVYFTSDGWGEVGLVSDRNHTQFGDVVTGGNPECIGSNPVAGLLYVPFANVFDQLAYLNATANATILGSVRTGAAPGGIASDPADHRLFVVDQGSSTVSVLNDSTLSLEGNVTVGTAATGWTGGSDPIRGILYDPINGFVYVADTDVTNVSVFNASSLAWVANVSVGYQPDLFALDPSNDTIFVSNMVNVTLISGATDRIVGWFGPWSSYAQPEGLAFDPLNNTLYVALEATDQLVAWNLTTGNHTTVSLRASPFVGGHPGTIALDATHHVLYVAETSSNYIAVVNISSNTLLRSISLSAGPLDLASNGSSGTLWISEPAADSVLLTNATGATLDTLRVGRAPIGVVPIDNFARVAIANSAGGSVDLVAVVYDLKVNESGLPSGRTWSISIANQSWTVHASSFVTEMPNGTFPYNAENSGLFTARPARGNVSVTGGPANLTINYSPPPKYTVRFNESGLPTGKNWTVDVNGTQMSGGGALNFSLTNGSYTYSVPNASGYSPHPGRGSIEINGSGLNLSIRFTPAPLFAVEFNETGLAPGLNWSVTVNGSVYASLGSSITLNLTNGTYSYAVSPESGYIVHGGDGTVRVRGGPAWAAGIVFTPLYGVEFREVGLPAGTNWTIVLNGTSQSGTTAQLNFSLPSGTYAWTALPVPGYVRPSSATVTISGADVLVNVTFVPFTYSVAFTETGLPIATDWSVVLGNATLASSGPTIRFVVANGTYAYRIGGVPGWTTIQYVGSVEVQGGDIGLSVPWNRSVYPLVFNESGLPVGTVWWVNLTNGLSLRSSGTSVEFRVPNGTFAYAVATANKQYQGLPGTALVAGRSEARVVAFSLVVFPVDIEANGIPNGTAWALVIQPGVGNLTTDRPNRTVDEPNGSYRFIAQVVGGGYAVVRGTFSVQGGPVSIPVDFVQLTYAVSFAESGLPPASAWTVIMNGVSHSGSGVIQVGSLPNGSYAFSIDAVPGYAADPSQGTLRINGSSQTQSVTFIADSAPSAHPASGTSSAFWAILAVSAITAGAILLAWFVRRRRHPSSDGATELTGDTDQSPSPGNGSDVVEEPDVGGPSPPDR